MKRKTTGLIVALDDPNLERCEELAKELAGYVDACKIGMGVFARHGTEALWTVGRHSRVFCDLKLHDIPIQVGRAAEALSDHGVWMFTIHASGGRAMIRAAVEGARRGGGAMVAAVTVLTSISPVDLSDIGQGDDPLAQAYLLGEVALSEGVNALVASGHETRQLAIRFGDRAQILVPGVRLSGQETDDQARVVTPGEAAAAGADYVVVGRPITEAADPLEAANRIREELNG